MSGYTAAVAAVAGTAYSVYSGERANSMQIDANNKAQEAAKKQESLADQANNRASQKKPDTLAILDAAQNMNKGITGTMLTGPSGVDAAQLQLGKNTLLGS